VRRSGASIASDWLHSVHCARVRSEAIVLRWGGSHVRRSGFLEAIPDRQGGEWGSAARASRSAGWRSRLTLAGRSKVLCRERDQGRHAFASARGGGWRADHGVDRRVHGAPWVRRRSLLGRQPAIEVADRAVRGSVKLWAYACVTPTLEGIERAQLRGEHEPATWAVGRAGTSAVPDARHAL